MITTKSKSYEEQVKLFAEHIKEAGAIVVGAASGMSAAAGTGTTMNGIRTL